MAKLGSNRPLPTTVYKLSPFDHFLELLHVEDMEELAVDLGAQSQVGLLFIAAAVENNDRGVRITLMEIGDKKRKFFSTEPRACCSYGFGTSSGDGMKL